MAYKCCPNAIQMALKWSKMAYNVRMSVKTYINWKLAKENRQDENVLRQHLKARKKKN